MCNPKGRSISLSFLWNPEGKYSRNNHCEDKTLNPNHFFWMAVYPQMTRGMVAEALRHTWGCRYNYLRLGYSSMGFPGDSDSKESACNVGNLDLIPGLERSPGEGPGNPFQYSCLENPHGQRSLAGYSPWGCKESDMTERLSTAQRSTEEKHRGVHLGGFYGPNWNGLHHFSLLFT